MKRLVLTCLCLLAATPAHANNVYFMGNNLFSLCEGQARDADFCKGFILGAYDSYVMMFGKQLFCMPGESTGQQIVDVAIGYLRNHPETRHEVATNLVLKSLQEAFPC